MCAAATALEERGRVAERVPVLEKTQGQLLSTIASLKVCPGPCRVPLKCVQADVASPGMMSPVCAAHAPPRAGGRRCQRVTVPRVRRRRSAWRPAPPRRRARSRAFLSLSLSISPSLSLPLSPSLYLSNAHAAPPHHPPLSAQILNVRHNRRARADRSPPLPLLPFPHCCPYPCPYCPPRAPRGGRVAAS